MTTLASSRNFKQTELAEFQANGAEILVQEDMHDGEALEAAFKGADVVISAVPASKTTVTVSEPIWLDGAVKAGVKRFVPTEFGTHTRSLEMGEGILFDYKKQMYEKIFQSGIGWTFFYTGGIMDYFVLNLRFFEKITTFGDLDCDIPTHDICRNL